jgi:hypothetical protein
VAREQSRATQKFYRQQFLVAKELKKSPVI